MVESFCPICASPVQPDQSHCARCGASLAADTTGSAELPPEAATAAPFAAPFGDAGDLEPYEDPRLTLAFEPEPDENPAERLPGGYVPPSPGLEPPAWAMRPSSSGASPRQPGSSISLQLGARPISLTGREEALAPEPQAEHAPVPQAEHAPVPQAEHAAGSTSAPPATPGAVPPVPLSVPEPAPAPEPFGAPGRPAFPVAAAPVAPMAPPPPEPAPAVPAAPVPNESIRELVAFGLVAAGASLGVASLFLPWAGVTGIGIGTESIAGSPPPPNQWGWGMPAGFPLLLLSLPVLVAAAASDRAEARFPNLAPAISRVTDLVLPMVLGGLYLGVVLMYMTVPAGYGPGLFLGQLALALGAGLLIAGAVTSVFLPPEVDLRPD